MSDFDDGNGLEVPPKSPQSLRTRIAAVLDGYVDPGHRYDLADAVIRQLGAIPDRSHVDDYGRVWEWCGGQPRTWAWRITAINPVEVKCAVCQRTYSVRADVPGWSSVWTVCISCQANEENEWLNVDE